MGCRVGVATAPERSRSDALISAGWVHVRSGPATGGPIGGPGFAQPACTEMQTSRRPYPKPCFVYSLESTNYSGYPVEATIHPIKGDCS